MWHPGQLNHAVLGLVLRQPPECAWWCYVQVGVGCRRIPVFMWDPAWRGLAVLGPKWRIILWRSTECATRCGSVVRCVCWQFPHVWSHRATCGGQGAVLGMPGQQLWAMHCASRAVSQWVFRDLQLTVITVPECTPLIWVCQNLKPRSGLTCKDTMHASITPLHAPAARSSATSSGGLGWLRASDYNVQRP